MVRNETKHKTYRAGFYNLGWTELRAVRPGPNSKKKSGGFHSPRHKTGYVSFIFTAWGEPTMSPALPGAGDSIDMKKFALDHLFAS
jgi:hypothetical protein